MEPCVDIVPYGVGHIVTIKQPSSNRDRQRRPAESIACTIAELRELRGQIDEKLAEFDADGSGLAVVMINAKPHKYPLWHKLSYADILETVGAKPDKVLSVIWKDKGINNGGSLMKTSDPIPVRNGLIIDACDTSSA